MTEIEKRICEIRAESLRRNKLAISGAGRVWGVVVPLLLKRITELEKKLRLK